MSVAWDSDITLTVEAAFGFGPTSTPTWTDISAYVREIEIQRGRSRVLDQTQAGEMILTLKNGDSRFEPDNTTGPYTGDLKPLVPVRVQAVYSSTTYDLYRGFFTAWPQETRHNLYGDVVAPCLDAFHIFAMVEESMVENQQGSGTRIGNLLDRADWPAGWRNLDSGTHICAVLSSEWNTVLGECQRAELVEQGLFYMAANGDATFKDSRHRLNEAVSITFSDDGADIAWVGDRGIEPTLDTAQLWNVVEVTRTGGVTQQATNSASRTTYAPRVLSLSETLHVADGEANALAEWLLSEYKDADRTLVRSLRVEPQGDPAGRWASVLGADLWDKVTVERTPTSSSTAITADYFIEGISHRLYPKDNDRGAWWESTFQLSPDLAHSDWWILGTSELGTDTRLGY